MEKIDTFSIFNQSPQLVSVAHFSPIWTFVCIVNCHCCLFLCGQTAVPFADFRHYKRGPAVQDCLASPNDKTRKNNIFWASAFRPKQFYFIFFSYTFRSRFCIVKTLSKRTYILYEQAQAFYLTPFIPK
jgi:hypothetical protein